MIEVNIETLMVGMPPSPSVIILRPINAETDAAAEQLVLPIWIGPSEAAAIGVALEGAPHQRPMTHDLLATMLKAMDGNVESILINRVEGSTFYAKVLLTKDGQTTEIDARPSDSIALALRMQAPLFVDEAVMEQAALPYLTGQASEQEIQAELAEFQSFLENVQPEDFQES